MLTDDRCSIYEHRPRTCRTYDCRIFPAAGLQPDDQDEGRGLIGQRARRWRFEFPTEMDQAEHDAVRAAAGFLRVHEDLLTAGFPGTSSTQLAVQAVAVHGVFLGHDDGTGRTTVVTPTPTTSELP